MKTLHSEPSDPFLFLQIRSVCAALLCGAITEFMKVWQAAVEEATKKARQCVGVHDEKSQVRPELVQSVNLVTCLA